MKLNRPLQNPDPTDYKAELVIENTTEEISEEQPIEISKDQISLDLDNKTTKVKQFLSGLKTIFRKRNDLIEVSQIWKTPAFPFAMVTSVINFLIFLYIAVFRFNDIPPTVPVFYNSVNKNWNQVDKSVIFMFPVILAIANFIIIQFSSVIFRKDRRLALTMVWIQTFLNTLLFVAILQIFTLVVE